MAVVGAGILVVGIGLLFVAAFWALDRRGRATQAATMFADVSAGLGNRYWARRVQRLRWLFAFIFGCLGVAGVVGGVALILFTAS